jgi:hypothetical protein
MPMLEDVLAEKTYKQDGLDVAQRVFYTLIAEPDNPHREKLQAHRNSKAIALLFQISARSAISQRLNLMRFC